MFIFLNHPLNQRFARVFTTFFSNLAVRVVGVARSLTYGPGICRVKDNVIAAFIVFSLSLVVFNQICYSFAMSAVFLQFYEKTARVHRKL